MPKLSKSLKAAETGGASFADYTKYHLQPDNETNINFKMVGISYFQGKLYVSLREHQRFIAFGKCYPTKKGIHLTVEQWMRLESLATNIDECIATMNKSKFCP